MERTIDRPRSDCASGSAELPDGRLPAQRFVDHDGQENRLYKVVCTLTQGGRRRSSSTSPGTDPAIVGTGQRSASGTYGAVGSAILARLRLRAALERRPDAARDRQDPAEHGASAPEPPAPISAGSVAPAPGSRSAARSACMAKLLAFSRELPGLRLRPARRVVAAQPVRRRQPVRRALRDHVHGPAGLGRRRLPLPRRRRHRRLDGRPRRRVHGRRDGRGRAAAVLPLAPGGPRTPAAPGATAAATGSNSRSRSTTPRSRSPPAATQGDRGAQHDRRLRRPTPARPAGTSRGRARLARALRRREGVRRSPRPGGERFAARRRRARSRSAPGDTINHDHPERRRLRRPGRAPGRAAVLRDVLRGSVTPEMAQKLYGVVIAGGEVDEEATAQAPARRSSTAGSPTLPAADYDHSPRELPVLRSGRT